MRATELSLTELSPTGDLFPFSWSEFSLETASWSEELPLSDGLRGVESASLTERFAPAWSELLARAVEEPGLICDAYTRFHGYSLGNRFAALIQCEMRGLEPGPLNSFNGWRKLGYAIKEGEKALTLCMPLKGTLHRKKADSSGQKRAPLEGGHPDVEEVEYIRAFVWKPSWFVLSQTVPLGENVEPLPAPAPLAWDGPQALSALDIQQVPFDLIDGNSLGFARKREIAVSPLAPYQFKTLFHELAHVVLGHTTDNFRGEGNVGLELSDGPQLSRALIEVEAESVALLCLATLDLPGQEFCRGYIQHWLSGEEGDARDIPEKSAQRIFGAADRILCAGVGEARLRAPTADEVGLNGSSAPTLPVSGSRTSKVLDPEAASGQGLSANAATLSHSEATSANPLKGNQVKAAPASEIDAWALYGHLQQLHSELHPAQPERSASFADALRHLKSRDASATREVQELVKGASRSLKRAFGRLEEILEAPRPLGAEIEEEFDPFEDMETGEVRHSPEYSTPEKSTATNATDIAEPPPLSPTRQAAARRTVGRTVGRTLRSELQFEKDRFSKAAKGQELPLGRGQEKAMLAAIATYLELPITSRRDLSSHQWARLASAIETQDLRWEKS